MQRIITVLMFILSVTFWQCDRPKRIDRTYVYHVPNFPQTDSLKVKLGRTLFFDPRLSATDSISCASCHVPAHSFADPNPLSMGIFQRTGLRNAPALVNLFAQTHFFHDGRARTIEKQMEGPLGSDFEMGIIDSLAAKLQRTEYAAQFQQIYGDSVRVSHVIDAISEFQRTLIFADSPFDRFMAGDSNALTPDQRAGFVLFTGKANCSDCHTGWNLADSSFHNIGFFNSQDSKSDKGRWGVTMDDADLGKFKTPSLRNVALTAPYFHDGRTKTLRDVLNLYNKPNPMGFGHYKDSLIKPIHLTPKELWQLHRFLEALTDDSPLRAFTSKASIDSVLARNRYPREEFERDHYLPMFTYRFPYLKSKRPDALDRFPINPDRVDDQAKIRYAKTVLDSVYRDWFESGSFLAD